MELIETDVLVIGGGGAGLRAAIAASDKGVYVSLILKGQIGGSGSTCMAMGAMAGVGPWHETGDSRNVHFNDTLEGGAFLNEQKLVRILVNEAHQRILELEQYGAFFERSEDGKHYLLRIDGGHSYNRSPYLEDRIGHELLRAMTGELLKRGNVRIFENYMVTRLLTNKKRVVGATTINLNNGRFVVFKSKAIVLATGGAGQLYPSTSQPIRNTGDGFALALQSGAQLVDMEFVQFYPLGLVFPESISGLIVGTLYYCHLFNAKGERIMEKYDPERLELSTRDIISRGVYKEIQDGRATKRGAIYCDLTFNSPGFIKRQLPFVHTLCTNLGIDPEKEMLEVAPTCHYFMGGVRVNERWETNISGLFAAGEVVGGVHGANRLSQNSLTDIVVSGARAGKNSAEYTFGIENEIAIERSQIDNERERVFSLLGSKGSVKPFEFKLRIKELMWRYVGIVRDGKGLRLALREIEALTEDLSNISIPISTMRYNMDWIDAIEAHNMISTAEVIARSALARKETRGAHYREDYPEKNDSQWLKHLIIELEDDKINLSRSEVDLSETKPRVK